MQPKTTIACLLLPIGILCVIKPLTIHAQAYIKVHGVKINHLDKQHKKQGPWFFFNNDGEVLLSCAYTNDSLISPLTFYQNNDTAFIKYARHSGFQDFTVYYNRQAINGTFRFEADSLVSFVLPSEELSADTDLVNKIKSFYKVRIKPLYYFGQQKIEDYFSYAFANAKFIFNKRLKAEITINSAGLVTSVELPKEKNNLSDDEERELKWIYSQIPRWQPLFENDDTKEFVWRLGSNMTITPLSN